MLKRFLKMSGNTYPDLIRVFYTNLQFVGNNLVSHVKGLDMEITHEVWTAITGLKYAGLQINKWNIGVVEEFNKIQFYKNFLKNLQAKVRNFSVGGLKLNERLIALIVTWMLTPRGSNHFVYMYYIMNKVKINWIHIINEHMQKSMRLSDYHYPYAVLISIFLNYFKVDLEEKHTEVVKSSLEINNGSLSKMGFTKIGGKWVSKEGDQGGSSSGVQAEQEEEDLDVEGAGVDAQEEHATTDIGVGTSARNQGERILSTSPFERFMVNRMDNFAEKRKQSP